MIIQIKDTDIEYLKTLVRCFNDFTAYVHEGVHITVDPYACVEVHEAATSLTQFRDLCIFPEFFEMLNDIREQIDGNTNIEKSESEFVFRIKQSDFNDPADFENSVKDMQLLIKFLCNANPNYYLLGDVLDKQLNEQLKEMK